MRFELATEPRACEPPLAVHGALGYAECFGGLRHGEPEQAAQLDDPRLPFAELFELAQRAIDRDQIDTAFVGREPRQGDALLVIAAALRRLPFACAIDEDLPHRERRDREEVLAVAGVE